MIDLVKAREIIDEITMIDTFITKTRANVSLAVSCDFKYGEVCCVPKRCLQDCIAVVCDVLDATRDDLYESLKRTVDDTN